MKSLFKRPPTGALPLRAPGDVRLLLERLEDRRVLSVTAFVDVGGILNIIGDGDVDNLRIELIDNGQSIQIWDDDANALIQIDDQINNVDVDFVEISSLASVHVDLGGGDDILHLQIPNLDVEVIDGADQDLVVLESVVDVPAADFATITVSAETIQFSGSELTLADVTLDLAGTLEVVNDVDVQLSGGEFFLNGDISGTGNLSIEAQSITLSLATSSLDGQLSLIADSIELAGDLSASDILVQGPVLLTGNVSLTTDLGDIDFSDANSSITGNGFDLSLDSAANLLLGAVDSAGAMQLDAVEIHLAGDLSADSLTASGDLILDGSDLTLSSNTGDLDLGLTAITSGTGNGILFLEAVSADVRLGTVDGIQQLDVTAAAAIVLTGNVSTVNSQDYRNRTLLNADVEILSDSGDVRFHDDIENDGGPFLLTVSTLTGDMKFQGAVGNSGDPLAGLNVTASGNLLFARELFLGDQGLVLDGSSDISFHNDVTISGNGNASVLNLGQLSFADGVLVQLSGGSFSQTGSGVVQWEGDLQTNSGDVEFQGEVFVSGTRLIETSGGEITFHEALVIDGSLHADGQDANVTFHGTVDGVGSLEVTAGSGNVLFVSDVGVQTELLGLTIHSSGSAEFQQAVAVGSGGFSVASIDTVTTGQVNSQGNITVTGDLVTGGELVAAGDVEVSGSSQLGANVTSQGGAVLLGTTTADSVTLLEDVILNAATEIEISGDVTGSQTLTLEAGNETNVVGSIGIDGNLNVASGNLSAGEIGIGGDLTADYDIATTTGGIQIGGDLLALSPVTISSATGLELDGDLSAEDGILLVALDGDLILRGNGTLTGSLLAVNGSIQLGNSGAETWELLDDLVLVALNDLVVPATIDGGGFDLAILAQTVSLAAVNGLHDLSILADNLELTSGAESVTGSGTLEFGVLLADTIVIGGSGDADPTTLNITDNDIAAFGAGWQALIFGVEGEPNQIDVVGATLAHDAIFYADGTGGSVHIQGQLNMLSGATLTIHGSHASTVQSADIITQGGEILINDALRIDGDVTFDTTDGGNFAGADITLEGGIAGFNAPGPVDSLTLIAGSGTAILQEAVGATAVPLGEDLEALIIEAAVAELHNDIVVAETISITANVDLVNSLLLSAGQTMFVDGDLSGTVNLTIQTGSGAEVTGEISGGIGDLNVNSGDLSAGEINIGGTLTAAANVETTTGGISAAEIDVSGNLDSAAALTSTTGDILVQGDVTATSVLAATNLDVGGNLITPGTVTATDGFVEIDGNLESTGVVAGTHVEIGGTSTLGGDVISGSYQRYGGAVTVTDDVTFEAHGDDAGDGIAIRFDSTLNDDGLPGTSSQVTFTTEDTLDLVFVGAVGQLAELDALQIQTASNVEFQSSLEVGFLQQDSGTGTTTFSGTVATSHANGIALTGTEFVFVSTVTTTNAGSVTIDNSSQLTVAFTASFSLDGSFAQTGSGDVSLGGDITTTGESISFNGPVTLTGGGTITLDTTDGNNVPAGAEITFLSTLNGTTADAENLILIAGTTGDVLFDDEVGQTTRLGAVTVSSARNVTVSAAVTAESLTQTTGTGTTAINGAVLLTGATGLQVDTADIEINADIDLNSPDAGGPIALNATNNIVVEAALLSGSGPVSLRADHDVTFSATGRIESVSGTVEVIADADLSGGASGGSLLMADGSRILAGSGTVTMAAAGDITLANVETSNATANAIAITSTAGSLLHGGDSHTDLVANMPNAVVTLIAFAGVGTTLNPLTTQVTALDITNQDSGVIQIRETDDLNLLGAIQQTSTGEIDIRTTNGGLSVGDGTNAVRVSTNGAGTIQLQAGGAAADLSILSGVSSDSGAINLSADRSIQLNQHGDITSTTGNITLTADDDGTSTGGITMHDDALIDAGTGEILLTASADIVLGGLTTTSASDDAVTVTSLDGGILDGGDTFPEIVAQSGQVNLDAQIGIGSGNALEIDADRLQVINRTSGNIELVEADALDLISLSQLGAGNATVETLDGTLTLLASGSGATVQQGTLSLIAGGADADLLIEQEITTTGGDVVLQASRDLLTSLGSDISTTGAAGQDSGNVTATAGRNLELLSDVITTGNTGAAGGDIQLTTTNGSILLTNLGASGGDDAATGGAAGSITVNAAGATSDLTLTGTLANVGGNAPVPGAHGTTTLTAGRDIIDGNDGGTLITTGDLSLSAGRHVGTITDFEARAGEAIDVVILGQLTGLSTAAAGGQLNLNVDGDLTVSPGAIDVGGANAAQLLIQTSGDLDVGSLAGALLLSDGDDVGLHSAGTLIVPDAGLNVGTGRLRLSGVVDVVDAALTRNIGPLTADSLIFESGATGGSTTLNTDVREVTADLSTAPATSGLTILEADDLLVREVVTSGGDVRIHAAQAAAGDLTLEHINAGSGMVVLDTTANGGSILDGDDTQTDVIASELAMRATTGIGTADDPLEVQVDVLAAVTETGDIQVRNLNGDLELGTVDGLNGVSITGATGGDIVISSPGSLNVTENVTNAGGDITLAADSDSGDLTVADGVQIAATSADGDVSLFAGRDLELGSGSEVSTLGGAIDLRAGLLFNDGGTQINGDDAGSVLMANGSLIASNEGEIAVRARGDVEIAVIDADRDGAGGQGDVLITADDNGLAGSGNGNGSISAPNGEPLNIRADNLVLEAATGIGSTAPLRTDVSTVTATNTVSGNVQIREVAGAGDPSLTVLGATTVNGNIDIQTEDGDLTIDGAVATTGAGTVTLIAGDADSSGTEDLAINASVTSVDGDIMLRSVGNDVTFSATGDITSSNGDISIEAGAGDGTGDVIQAEGSTVDAGNGKISVDAHGQITLGRLVTLNADDDAVVITTTGNLDSANPGNAALINITAPNGRLVIDTEDGVGPLRTNVDSLDLINRLTGDVTIIESDALDVVRTEQLAVDNLDITTGGTLRILDQGVSATSGNVTLAATGASSDLDVQTTVTTLSGNITLAADRDLLLGAVSEVATQTGDIQAGADRHVVMTDGAEILGGTGRVDVISGNNLTVGRIVTTGDVRLTANHGGIFDGGDTGGADIVATQLAMTAATGIGSSNPLETEVDLLAALNSGSGNIQVDNQTGTLLTIGTFIDPILGDLVGITNAGTGNGTIQVTNDGALTVASGVANLSGGQIQLTATANGGDDDHLTVLAPILATGPQSNIFLNAGTDLILTDTGLTTDIQGRSITGTAARDVVYGPNFLIRSSTGAITAAMPFVQNIDAPQVTSQGIAFINGEIGQPGDETFLFNIVWDPNGPITDDYQTGQNYQFVGSGSSAVVPGGPGAKPVAFSFDHFYAANPDPVNPAADIPITITIFDDPNITLIANGQDLGQVTTTVLADVPGTGIQSAMVYDLSIEVPTIEAPRVEIGAAQELLSGSATISNESLDAQGVVESEGVRDERVIIIEKIGPDGEVERDAEGQPIQLLLYGDDAQQVLDDLATLYQKLQDGRWRISLQEGEDAQPQLIRDVVLRGGKTAGEDAGTQDRPPTESESEPAGMPQAEAGPSGETGESSTEAESGEPAEPAEPPLSKGDLPSGRVSDRAAMAVWGAGAVSIVRKSGQLVRMVGILIGLLR